MSLPDPHKKPWSFRSTVVTFVVCAIIVLVLWSTDANSQDMTQSDKLLVDNYLQSFILKLSSKKINSVCNIDIDVSTRGFVHVVYTNISRTPDCDILKRIINEVSKTPLTEYRAVYQYIRYLTVKSNQQTILVEIRDHGTSY